MSFQPQKRGVPTPTGGLLESETEVRQFLPSLCLLPWFPAYWTSCRFHCAGFSSHSASTAGAFAELHFCCAWPSPHGGQANVVSARLNLRNGTIYVRGVFNFPSSVSLQQKCEATDGLVLQLSFIWQAKENTSSRDEGWLTPKRREEKPTVQFWLHFLHVFSPPPEPFLCKLG